MLEPSLITLEYTKKLSKLLTPTTLSFLMKRYCEDTYIKKPRISIIQLVSNTLKIGSRIHTAILGLSKELNINVQTFQARKGENHESFFENISTNKDDFIILQIQGIESEERLLESFNATKMAGKLIIYIHRPEELILRIAFEEGVSYSVARSILATKLEKAKAIVLSGDCYINEYKEMLPKTIVAAIPLGFSKPDLSVDISSRLSPGATVCIGSNTTWGEMRHIDDLLKLLLSINYLDKDIKFFGYALGSFDLYTKLEQYLDNPHVLFMSNEEILTAYQNNVFSDENSFREWLYNKAGNKLVLRAKVENRIVTPQAFSVFDNLLYQWESVILDFDVQMYHEILDSKREPEKRGLPKVEYSGTLHKGADHVIFVVFESMAMQDVEQNEGFTMINVPVRNGIIDYYTGARQIIYLIKNSAIRKDIIKKNIIATKLISMKEVVFAYYILMRFINEPNFTID